MKSSKSSAPKSATQASPKSVSKAATKSTAKRALKGSVNGFPAPGKNKLFDTGLALRKKVLGSAYVDKAIEGADDFTRPLQQLVTEYCWGEIWGSDALSNKTRSLLNLAMLTALNRKDEIKLHTRGAIANGCTVAEVQAVLLQACIYCGVPAAIDSSKVMRETLKEIGALK